MSPREEAFLPDELLRQLMSVGEVDLIVGIRAHHDGAAIEQVIQQVENICLRTFVRDRIALIGIDGHRNGASPAIEEASPLYRHSGALRTVHRLTIGSKIHPADGTTVRQLFSTADLLRAKAVAMISPSTAQLPQEWLTNLLSPVRRDNFDYVAPLYRRHWNQGLLIRTLLYPMTRAVFGFRIREMYSEDFAFSGGLLARAIDRDFWQQEEAFHSRTESWMAVQALETGMPVCQAFLGQKDYPVSASGAAIVDAIRQAVGTLFSLMETHQTLWQTTSGSAPVRTIGPEHDLIVEPVRVNRSRLFEMFHVGVSELAGVLRLSLPPETHAEMRALAAADGGKLVFPSELWVRALYEFAAAYHRSVIDRDHLVQALVPLYRGKIGAFFEGNSDATPDSIEAGSESLCLEFERQKPYLMERWNATPEVPS